LIYKNGSFYVFFFSDFSSDYPIKPDVVGTFKQYNSLKTNGKKDENPRLFFIFIGIEHKGYAKLINKQVLSIWFIVK